VVRNVWKKYARLVAAGIMAVTFGGGFAGCARQSVTNGEPVAPVVTEGPANPSGSVAEGEQPAAPAVSANPDSGVTVAETVKWQVPDDVAALNFADGSVYYPEVDEAIEVGQAADGDAHMAFLRLPLGSDFFGAEVQQARLFLKPVSAQVPDSIAVGAIGQSWTAANTDNPNEAGLLPEAAAMSTAPVVAEPDGWVSLDVTDQVKDWLTGAVRNNGLVLSGVTDQPVADFSVGEPNLPYFEVSGEVGPRQTGFGQFGFTQQPEEGDVFTIEDSGNCLSYALRDNDSILFQDLGLNYDDINRIFVESGDDGVAEYVAKHIEDYVSAHQDTLKISNFRRLDNYDSPIDPTTEYRIALRIGASQPGGLPMQEDGGFDYHLWAQLDDGRWSQKFPQEYSAIIPGTGAGISPAQNLWDSGRQFGWEKTQDFYQSKVIYFAVTKDTPEFTAHRSA